MLDSMKIQRVRNWHAFLTFCYNLILKRPLMETTKSLNKLPSIIKARFHYSVKFVMKIFKPEVDMEKTELKAAIAELRAKIENDLNHDMNHVMTHDMVCNEELCHEGNNPIICHDHDMSEPVQLKKSDWWYLVNTLEQWRVYNPRSVVKKNPILAWKIMHLCKDPNVRVKGAYFTTCFRRELAKLA